MVKLFRCLENRRNTSNIANNYIPLTEKFKKIYIFKYTPIYNNLDCYIKKKSIKSFKKEIKAIYMYRPVSDTND